MGSKLLRITAVTLALLATTPALAQEAAEGADTSAVTMDNDGFDWGWIGLLGLLGLAGLAGRRDNARTGTTGTTRL